MPEPEAANPVKYKVLFAILLAAGLFARAYHLGDKVMWSDEGFVYHAAVQPSIHDLRGIYRLEQHTAQHNIVTYCWIRAFGKSMAALHAQSLAWSALTLLIFGALVWKLFPPYAAACALGAMALNPLLAEYAQALRYPALAGLHGMICFASLLMLRRTGRAAWLAAYACGLLLFVFVHLFSALTIASLFIFVLLTRRAWGRLYWPLLACHVIAAAAIVPKLLLMRETGVTGLAAGVAPADIARHLAGVPIGGVADTAFQFAAGRTVPMRALPLSALAGAAAVFGIVAAAALAHARRRFEARLAAFALACPVLLGWASMILRSVHFHPFYFVPLVPLFCMLIGLGADCIRAWRPLAAHALMAAIAAFSVAMLCLYWARIDRPPNYRTLAAHIEDNAQPGDFLAMSPPYFYYIEYYWRDRMPASRFAGDHDLRRAPQNMLVLLNSGRNQITDHDMRTWHRAVASRHKRVWMFWPLGVTNTEDRNATAFRWMEAHYERIYSSKIRNFPHMSEYTGFVALYRVRDIEAEAVSP